MLLVQMMTDIDYLTTKNFGKIIIINKNNKIIDL